MGYPPLEPPPPPTKVTIVGKNEIYRWGNLVGPFFFGTQTVAPPPPLCPPF